MYKHDEEYANTVNQIVVYILGDLHGFICVCVCVCVCVCDV